MSRRQHQYNVNGSGYEDPTFYEALANIQRDKPNKPKKRRTLVWRAEETPAESFSRFMKEGNDEHIN